MDLTDSKKARSHRGVQKQPINIILLSAMKTQDLGGRKSHGVASLIEIVTTDVAAMNNMNLNLTTSSSHSLSSGADSSEADAASCEFPALRRTGSYPLPTPKAAPPRRPSRSSSIERHLQANALSLSLDAEEDEIDHQKFRQLLLGKNVGETNDHQDDLNTTSSSDARIQGTQEELNSAANDPISPMFKLRPRKSFSSAPPKIPNRVGSDHSERATPPALGRIRCIG